MITHVSHGAGSAHLNGEPDWFVVMPDPRSDPGMHDRQVEWLRKAGRTVIEIDVEPWNGFEDHRESREWAAEQRRPWRFVDRLTAFWTGHPVRKDDGRAREAELLDYDRANTPPDRLCDACGLTQEACPTSCPARLAGGWER